MVAMFYTVSQLICYKVVQFPSYKLMQNVLQVSEVWGPPNAMLPPNVLMHLRLPGYPASHPQ